MSLLIIYALTILSLSLGTAYGNQKKRNNELSLKYYSIQEYNVDLVSQNEALINDNYQLSLKKNLQAVEIDYIKLKLKYYDNEITEIKKFRN